MIIDGKLIAHELKTKLKERTYEIDPHLSLGIIVTEETPATKQFVKIKQLFASNINVETEVLELAQMKRETEDLLELILHASRKFDGVILQLPIPQHFNLSSVLNLFPFTQDVDVIGNAAYQQFKEGSLPFLPPVVGAFAEVLHKSEVRLTGKKVLVVGDGRLVGAPSAIWAERLGAYVTVATKETDNLHELTKDADAIILGAGVPGLLKPEMIKDGVIILDAGAGDVNGKVMGDAMQECAEKASVFTPTPGGIGPITVAKLFENLVALDDIKHSGRK
jgi:5,10-methylene-tetrahydrofolate dehydrogenase/methenyl tetrahydrofolate cyclohydrolase